MKSLFLLALNIVFVSNALFAQPSFTVSDKEDANLIKTKTLAVVVKEKDEKVVKNLSKKPEELKAYIESIAAFNSYLNQAVSSDWKFSSNVKFVSEAEADKMKEEKNASYCVLYLAEVTAYKMNDFYSANDKAGFNTPQAQAYHLSPTGKAVALAIAYAAKPKEEIVMSYLPLVGMTQSTVTFMVANIQNQLNDCLTKDITKLGALKDDIETRRPQLKTKTLLIFDPLICKAMQKAIDKNELAKFYDYKYEVVSLAKVEEVIDAKDKNYAYIWVIPAGAQSGGKTLYNYFIIDAADSRPLYLTGTAVVGANGSFHQYHLMNVKKKMK